MSEAVFTTTHLLLGITAALIIGLSKTALPGGGLLATPLMAMVVSGRLIAGTTLPILLLADLFAVGWYWRNARFDIVKPLVVPVSIGFAGGTLFYWLVGSGGRTLDVVLGITILVMVAIQVFRIVRKSPPMAPSPSTVRVVGVSGGFTTFIANSAGPVLNTFFTSIGLPKARMVGTSAVFFFSVNLAKVPVYLAIGSFSSGGHFFTAETLRFDLALAPAIIVGVYGGRWLLPRIPQRMFTYIVLTLVGASSLKLLFGL